jgi:hypothetical protein
MSEMLSKKKLLSSKNCSCLFHNMMKVKSQGKFPELGKGERYGARPSLLHSALHSYGSSWKRREFPAAYQTPTCLIFYTSYHQKFLQRRVTYDSDALEWWNHADSPPHLNFAFPKHNEPISSAITRLQVSTKNPILKGNYLKQHGIKFSLEGS